MKNQAYNTNGQQSKKSGNGKWLRWALLVLLLTLLVGDGVVGGRWSEITRAGNEDETTFTPSELVVEEEVEEVVEEPVEEPVSEPEPEVTEKEEIVEEVAVEIVEVPVAEETVQSEIEENQQEPENKERIEQETASAEVEQPETAEGTEEETLEVAEEVEPEVERTVAIYSNLEDTIGVNDTFEMTAELSGFDGVEYTVQWQRNEGFGWEDIAGANDLVLELPASVLDVQAGYRLVVNVEA